MPDDLHAKNPTFLGDYGPPVEVQARRTGIAQTGRLVVIDNPISYVVEPGRYYPFLSLRGHTDPLSTDLAERLQLGDVFGEGLPSNQEPAHVTPGYQRTIAGAATRGAVTNPTARLANTTLAGTGPQQLPMPEAPDGPDFMTGIPHSLGLEGV